MRFQLIDRAKQDLPVHHLCGVLGVSQSGYFARKDRPASRRQRDEVVILAHVRSAFALSSGTCGSPRMTGELQDDGFPIGRSGTARPMRENGPRGRQKRRLKAHLSRSKRPWSRRSSRPSNPNSSGKPSSIPLPRPRRPLTTTSMAYKTCSGATSHSTTLAPRSLNEPRYAEQMPLHLSRATLH